MNPKDAQLIALRKAFENLDFSQPHAHEVYDELKNSLESIVCHPDDTVWREFFFFNLGHAFAKAEQQYKTIPPIVHKEEMVKK